MYAESAQQNSTNQIQGQRFSLPDGLLLPKRDEREGLLRALADGVVPVSLIFSGLPGSGKTTLLGQLFEREHLLGSITPTTRLLPRERRETDPPSDVPWSAAPTQGNGATYTPDQVLFSNQKYQGYYAFPASGIKESLVRGSTPAMMVTSYSEMMQLIEGISNVIPLAPITSIRVEVPHDVLPSRIMVRPGAHPNEHIERIEKLGNLVRADQLQARPLHTVYGTRSVVNVTEKEIRDFGFFAAQMHPVTPDALAAMVVEAASIAVSKAAHEAKDILTPRVLTYGMAQIPDSIIDVLDRVVLPTVQKQLPAEKGLDDFIIKAGLAAAIYLGPNARVVSPDIDFTFEDGPQAKVLMEQVMEALCPTLPEWTDGMNKAVYHCEGLKGEAVAKDQTVVELDAILTTRVQPSEQGFCFMCQHDELDLFHRRTVTTPGGYSFSLVPPEQLCVEKLIAGRGPDINKFDLFDAAGLLSQFPLNPNLVKKMIEVQGFRPEVDEAAAQVIRSNAGDFSPETLSRLGIKNTFCQTQLQRIVAQDSLATVSLLNEITPGSIPAEQLKRSELELSQELWEQRRISVKSLKQMAMISSVLESLSQIERILNDRVFTIDGKRYSISDRFDPTLVQAGVARLRDQMTHLAEFHIGTFDSYVYRGSNKTEMEKFFEKLPEQQSRLSKG